MTENAMSLTPFYKGWDVYQQHLVTTIAPLTPEQLALRAAPHQWSVGMLAMHIISTRVGWFHTWMSVGSPELAPMEEWDEHEELIRSVDELVTGLQATWQMIQDALASWTPDDLSSVFESPYGRKDEQGNIRKRSRQWIIWHVLEHDMHHGGELSLTLGSYGVAAMNL